MLLIKVASFCNTWFAGLNENSSNRLIHLNTRLHGAAPLERMMKCRLAEGIMPLGGGL